MVPVTRSPGALLPSGEPGSRRMRSPDGTVEFTEHGDCGWITLRVRTWVEWQKLARQILDAGTPEHSR